MKVFFRLSAIWLLVMAWGGPGHVAYAAVAERVQSGTVVNDADGVQTVTITWVDTTKSVLFFSARHDANRPGDSSIRGRLASATTIEFVRNTDSVPAPDIVIQWYVVTFGVLSVAFWAYFRNKPAEG